MSRTYPVIDDTLAAFIRAQHVYFVATAPSGDGHINISPKGLDTFRILDPTSVAYLDLTGSGIETVAHLRENGRIAIMFCAFTGAPKILRLHGHGEVIEPGVPAFAHLRALFPGFDAVRSVIRVMVERVSDSCGYGVPLFAFERERTQLPEWAARKGADGVARYQTEHNAASVDGLPGLRRPKE